VSFGLTARAVATGTALCALLAGCTGGSPPGSSPSPSATASGSTSAAPDPVTIDFAVYGPSASIEAYRELAASFTEQQPHVSVDVTRVGTPEAMLGLVGSGDAPDVFLIDHDHLPALVQDELVQPVNALLEERQVDFGDGYQRSGLTAFAASAALQCMPHDVSPMVVYYNKDLVDFEALAEEGEEPVTALDGWDWATFTAAAHAASQGPAHGLYIEPAIDSLAPFIWSAGGQIVDDPADPSTLTLSEGDARGALEEVLALVRDPQVTPTGLELERQDAVTRFRNGRLGMILGTRALTPVLRDAEGLEFDVMPLPSLGRVRSVADMTGYCIAAETDAVGAAADFLTYAVSREGAAITARPGYVVPSNLEVANSAVFNQPALQPESAFVFNESVRRSQSTPFVPEWPELTEAVEPDLERLFYAPVIDLDSALEQLDVTSTRVLTPQEEEQEEAEEEQGD
jgi:multiple sugar transport system substrate-binding protein